MDQVVDKKVNMKLVGLDGNSFVLLGSFAKEAQRQGWTKEEVGLVLDKAKSGNYDNLLAVLLAHIDNAFGSEDEFVDDYTADDYNEEWE